MADALRRLAEEALVTAGEIWKSPPEMIAVHVAESPDWCGDGCACCVKGDCAIVRTVDRLRALYARLDAAEAARIEDVGAAKGLLHEALARSEMVWRQDRARIAEVEAVGKVVVDTWGRFDDPHTRCTEDPCLFCLTVAALARALEGTA